MASSKSAEVKRRKQQPPPELTDDEQRALQERAQQLTAQRAEIQLDLAKLFLEKQQPHIALRRLNAIVAEFPGTAAATEARKLIKKLKSTPSSSNRKRSD